MDMRLDEGTYGGTPAAKLLAVVLQETNNAKLTSKVSWSLHHFFGVMNDLESCTTHKEYVASLVWKDFDHRIAKNEEKWPSKVISLVRNIMKTRYRQFIQKVA